jgi:hypothetical protein
LNGLRKNFLGFDYRINRHFLVGVSMEDFQCPGIETDQERNAVWIVLTP